DRASVGRGWPVPVELGDYDGYPEEQFVGAVTPWYYEYNPAATGGDAPDGVTPLDRDLFTSGEFYADRELWMDPRYYRCNSPHCVGFDPRRLLHRPLRNGRQRACHGGVGTLRPRLSA